MIPKHIFLDTNVFDSQQYNFDSAVLRTFTAAAMDKKISLLLPHPADLEIRRHIRERSGDALWALHEARRAAPFLKKWEHFPKDSVIPDNYKFMDPELVEELQSSVAAILGWNVISQWAGPSTDFSRPRPDVHTDLSNS